METLINAMSWTPVTELVRQKSMSVDEKTVRILELRPGFEEANWCYKGHIGYVITGTLLVEFEDETRTFHEGEVVVLPTAVGHKAKTKCKTTLLLIDG